MADEFMAYELYLSEVAYKRKQQAAKVFDILTNNCLTNKSGIM